MTPMIDVVFLLIIFFLVSSHLAKQEIQQELDLPDASSGQKLEETQTRQLIVNVTKDGALMLAAQPVSLEQLKRSLNFERKRHGAEVEVRIRTDRAVAYSHVEPIMTACAENGIWNVSFSVVRKIEAEGA